MNSQIKNKKSAGAQMVFFDNEMVEWVTDTN